MASDPVLYSGAAAHYLRERPPYSAELLDTLVRELGLDGRGTLVDIGCGPGTLAVELSTVFERVIGIDPDAHMLREAERHALSRERRNIDWRNAYAEDLGALELPSARVVTFGQSFHWTQRHVVTDAVYDLLTPGGSLVRVTHDIDARLPPPGPGDPPIPNDESTISSPPTSARATRNAIGPRSGIHRTATSRWWPRRASVMPAPCTPLAEETSPVTSMALSPATCLCPTPRRHDSERSSTGRHPHDRSARARSGTAVSL